MLGLGETKDEVLKAMDDLVENGLLILTLGQYLQPTKMHPKWLSTSTPIRLKCTKKRA